MQTTEKKPKSEKKLQAQKLAGQLASMTEAERTTLAEKMGTVVNPAGHILTTTNTAFLMLQCGRENLTMVAGFRQWLKVNRAVRKGESSVGYIRVPMGAGKKRQEEAAANGEMTSARVFFKLVAVFDVSQTDELVRE